MRKITKCQFITVPDELPNRRELREWLNLPGRIDSMRGLACILLLFVHSTNNFGGFHGISLIFLDKINFIFSDVRMPLFTFISGIIYAFGMERNTTLRFMTKKFTRIVIPFFVFSAVLLIIKDLSGKGHFKHAVYDYYHFMKYGYLHMWFLQAIFIIFSIYWVTTNTISKRNALLPIIFLASSSVFLAFDVSVIKIFSFGDALRLLPFFALGTLMTAFNEYIIKIFRFIVPILVALTILAVSFSSYITFNNLYKGKLLSFLVGIFTLSLIYTAFPEVKLLRLVGKYSFTIFLLHWTIISILLRFTPISASISIPLLITLAILISILIEKICLAFFPKLKFVIGKGFN